MTPPLLTTTIPPPLLSFLLLVLIFCHLQKNAEESQREWREVNYEKRRKKTRII